MNTSSSFCSHGGDSLYLSERISSFSIELLHLYGCLVRHVMRSKITKKQATEIMMIPLWPTKPVFSTVLHLLIDVARIVKASSSNQVHPDSGAPASATQQIAPVCMQVIRKLFVKQFNIYINNAG